MKIEIPEDMKLKPRGEHYNSDLSKMIFHVCNWLNENGSRIYHPKEGVCYPTEDIVKAIRFAFTQKK